MLVNSDQDTINALTSSWVWTPDWCDSTVAWPSTSNEVEDSNTAGRIVRFTRSVHLPTTDSSSTVTSKVSSAILHFSADTRYKLYVNSKRVAVGPARSSPWIWYYDTLDIAPYLHPGDNQIVFLVLRYFVTLRGAMPFARTPFPGLTVVGNIEHGGNTIDISERISPKPLGSELTPVGYGLRTANGELAPWRLRPRPIAIPEETHVAVETIRKCDSTVKLDKWSAYFSGQSSLTLSAGSQHTLEVQADVHSTAFLQWTFHAVTDPAKQLLTAERPRIHLKIMYSEGYENEPRNYPFFRSKSDRLDAENGYIIGPFDEVTLDLPTDGSNVSYEPFWFRTLRIMRFHVSITGPAPVELISFGATQVNYPMGIKASWNNLNDADSAAMWDVSIRTLRNCMFDGYVDCPFYEQLQYSGDSRSVGLFHYLLAGDDQLMRQAISSFGASVLSEGLTQSRFPSHVPQIIAGFPLYWVMQICDHHLYFGDSAFSRSFLPRIDGVLDFFAQHVDTRGLVSRLPSDVWQYVDWVTTWGATDDHPDKGVPTAGRSTNCHTFFSMLYAVVLRQAARLARDVGRPGHADEYESRADSLVTAVKDHCYDGRFFADTTVDALPEAGNGHSSPTAYSQHCQVFAVLCGACSESDRERLLTEAFSADAGRFSKCSYVMQFYALRAFSLASDEAYETFLWPRVWQPWRKMLANNLSTWEEDDVRQRSDCHAWGSVPIYEFCTELAGVRPIGAGANKILFKPRLRLTDRLDAKVCLGSSNVASVAWYVTGGGLEGESSAKQGATARNKLYTVTLQLEKPAMVVSVLPGGRESDHGLVACVALTWRPE
ncbi:hypothetical protein HMPREF1624_07980 [Sporothrix schenckii ATCC 58251]|uniref:Alpha-L-rhamnosidase six-hairpin glycosidase domain-containing protein n=1 Tax=Sporothrix schenckii (strain ATCC 58251 / de Perez 2211183) TaxID=1391915 RepID=U7PL74_SPOS1|nr:hypothetical protein HMPREF1624_07980 [Sporothrix schenckii ATCC 58251]